ncbi:hypothetical protein LguiA_005844 [Lonicera macranthoides]
MMNRKERLTLFLVGPSSGYIGNKWLSSQVYSAPPTPFFLNIVHLVRPGVFMCGANSFDMSLLTGEPSAHYLTPDSVEQPNKVGKNYRTRRNATSRGRSLQQWFTLREPNLH